MDIDLEALKKILLPYLQDLKDFNFSCLNPLFWILLFVIFLVLLRFWETRKAFSFCLIAGIILLAATKVEAYLAAFGDPFAPFLARIILFFIMALVFIYYIAIK